MSTFVNPNVAQRHSTVMSDGLDTGDGTIAGLTSASLEGFYGTAPVAQQVVPTTSPTVQNVIDALVALGLVAQHD